MAERGKIVRLAKAAKEFNISIVTIVEFFGKKGHIIDGKPNTKLSVEQYDLLLTEFQAEKDVREEANKIGLDYTDHQTISIEDSVSKEAQIEKGKEQEELIIKSQTFGYDDKLHTSTPAKVEPKPEKTVEEPKEIAEEKVETKKKAEEKPAVEKKKGKKTEVAEIKSEEKKEKEKVESDKEEISEEKVKEKPKTVKSSKKAETLEKTEEKPVKEEAKEEIEKKTEESKEKETGLKILGTIDLEKIEPKPSPTKKRKTTKKTTVAKDKEKVEDKAKTEKAKEKPVEEKAKEEIQDKPETKADLDLPAVVVEEKLDKPSEVEKQKSENFLETKVEKLAGPTILGKMDLPEKKKPEKKKPVASSSDQQLKSKKKRKRISKPKTQKAPTTDQKTTKSSKQKYRDRKAKEHANKTELSEEEIQKQIKETLQRLSPTGKSKASKHRRLKREQQQKVREEEQQKIDEAKSTIKVTEFVTANELSTMMNVPVNEIISTCMALGMFVSINQRLDAETLTLVAEEFGFQVEFVSVEVQEAIHHFDVEDESEDLVERPPIVTVMGHVDHGKTSLLDYIRSANVMADESGGITQHVGAYEVKLDSGKSITFLDTPGHEAFTAMRARGAKVTDIAIIVVAADDNIMPQTVEAINHAQAAGVPIVIAINKIDKANANPEKLKEQLSAMNILVEDWGGKYQCQEISAKKGVNIDLLLEKVLLESEILDLKGNETVSAVGTVIESSLDRGRGYVAKLLVQDGTLRTGDIVLAGANYGRVKAMYNERNVDVSEAGPSTPVLMLGLNGAPQAGDQFNVLMDEKEVKAIATKRMQLQREQGIRTQKHITLDEIGRRIAIGEFKELNIIVKGDVDGSVEALSDSLLKLSTEEVQVNLIHQSVGAVTESDVMLASASNAIIVGFQVRPTLNARKLAEQEQIDIRLYSIIYSAINEIKDAIEGMLSPGIEEKIVCNIEVRETFKITKVGTIAGCIVLDGKVKRNTRVRIIRDGIVIYTGNLGSLKRFKDDAKEVQSGYECGLNIENFNDIKVGDIIEGYEEVEIKRKL